jgi:Insect pheromone-binding family, A10/OS-D
LRRELISLCSLPQSGILPEALRTSCDQCTQVQKTKVLEIIKRLYFQYPDKYIALAERYDQTGVYTRKFENWVEENSNFINDSEVTISNILTTKRRPVTKTTSTTVRPTFTLKLKTTTTPPPRTKTTRKKTASTSRRPLSTRQTTSTTTTTTTMSPLSFLVTFPSSTPTIPTTLRPQSQTFTISFTAGTSLSNATRPNLLLTNSQPAIPTNPTTLTTEKSIITTSRFFPSTTRETTTNLENSFVPENSLPTTTTSREIFRSTTTRIPSVQTTNQESTSNTAIVRNLDFDLTTPNTFVTRRFDSRPQEVMN